MQPTDKSVGPPSSSVPTPQASLPHVGQTAPCAPTARLCLCCSHGLDCPSLRLWLRIVKPYPLFKGQLKFHLFESFLNACPFSTPAKPGDDPSSQTHGMWPMLPSQFHLG